MSKLELRAVYGLGAIFSLRMFGMFMILPILTTYGMNIYEANKMLIGFAIGIYGLMQAIFQIPMGLLSDKFGRKLIIVFGLFIFACGGIIPILINNIWGLILGRALQGSGAITAAIMALLSDLTTEQNRTKAMAFIGFSLGLTFAISIVIGPILNNVIGIQGLFWIITLLALVGIILLLTVVPTTSGISILNRESSIIYSTLNKVLINSQLLKLDFSIFCLHMILMSIFMVLPSLLSYAGFLLKNQWEIYLVVILISFVAVIFIITFAETKRKIKNVFLSCIFLILLTEFLLTIASNNLYFIFISMQMFFLAFSTLETILPSMISKESPVSYKGTAMGVYSTSQFCGVACGGIASGYLYHYYGIPIVLFSCILITTIWLLISITLQEPSYMNSLRFVLTEHCITVTQANNLLQCLQKLPGISEVIIIPEEQSLYIKTDIKLTNRATIEKIIANI